MTVEGRIKEAGRQISARLDRLSRTRRPSCASAGERVITVTLIMAMAMMTVYRVPFEVLTTCAHTAIIIGINFVQSGHRRWGRAWTMY